MHKLVQESIIIGVIKVKVDLMRANMMYHKGRGFESQPRFMSTAATIATYENNVCIRLGSFQQNQSELE